MPSGSKTNLNEIMKVSQERIERLLLSGDLSHHYSLSLDLLTAAVNSLTALGALTKIKEYEVSLFL